MITTIQIHENVKKALDKLKEDKESYEEVILKLMEKTEMERRKNKELLIEGYKEMAQDSLNINEEWSNADVNWD